MLSINTEKKSNLRVKIDGFEYAVRKPGAGEAYFLSQATKTIQSIQSAIDNGTATDEQTEESQEITLKALKICVTLFDPLGNQDAKDSLDRVESETLFEIVGQVYGTLNDGTAEKK